MTRVFIIAEAGVNHNGSVERALEMVNVAAHAGVDAVKFQTFKSEQVISRFAKKADYQIQTTGAEETQLEMVKKLELNDVAHELLLAECQKAGVMFLSTPFDFPSIDLLAKLGMSIWKIPSGEITNLLYLRRIAKVASRVILSTGMSTLEEIAAALAELRRNPTIEITVLHCNTEYPTPMCDVNLQAMLEMRERFGVTVGYSDHTLGIEVPIAAVALGAEVIEKHFTLDRELPGPDHRASLMPLELAAMVRAIRNIEQALGDGKKRVSDSEAKNKNIARKSIVAARAITAGEVFTEENLTVKRPGGGISPMRWDDVIGKNAQRSYGEDEMIEW